MDDYTYGGTSIAAFPQTVSISENEIGYISKPLAKSRARVFFERILVQCAVCVTLLTILMLFNFIGNSFFNNLTQRINDEITTDANVSEIFGTDSVLVSLFETARDFFISIPSEQHNDTVTPYDGNLYENEADGMAPSTVSTDDIGVDPELLDTINNR